MFFYDCLLFRANVTSFPVLVVVSDSMHCLLVTEQCNKLCGGRCDRGIPGTQGLEGPRDTVVSLGKWLAWLNSKLCLGHHQLRCQFWLFFLWDYLMHVGFKSQLDTWVEFIQNLRLLLLGFLYSWIPSSVPSSCGWPEICLLALPADWLFVLEFYLLLSAHCCLGQSCAMASRFFQVLACAASRICLFCLLARAFSQTKQN